MFGWFRKNKKLNTHDAPLFLLGKETELPVPPVHQIKKGGTVATVRKPVQTVACAYEPVIVHETEYVGSGATSDALTTLVTMAVMENIIDSSSQSVVDTTPVFDPGGGSFGGGGADASWSDSSSYDSGSSGGSDW